MTPEIEPTLTPSRLYRVEISDVVYVMAGSAREAERIAKNESEACTMGAYASLNRQMPADPGWANSVPFSEGDDERTVAEIIAAWEPDYEERERAGQLRLLTAVG